MCMYMNRRICGALVQFGYYQHRHHMNECEGLLPLIFSLNYHVAVIYHCQLIYYQTLQNLVVISQYRIAGNIGGH